MKKKTAGFLLFVLMCLEAAGCGREHVSTDGEQGYHMYYTNAEETQVLEAAYETDAQTAEELINEFVVNQTKEPKDKKRYHALLPEGVKIESFVWDGSTVRLDLNSAYGQMEFTREIVSRVGLVRTFTQIPGVARVEMLVDGEPLKDSSGVPVGPMLAERFVENSGKEINTYQKITLTLYFTDAEGTKLVPEERTVSYSTNIPLERFVVEQLIQGPKDNGNYATLPADTRLLSVTISDDICYVNFDESVQTLMQNVKGEIQIYSIVNSLAQACDVSQVQVSINGDSEAVFKDKIKLNQLFQRDDSYIKGE